MDVSRIIQDIKSVRIQGAREIAKAGLRALAITARKSRAGSKKELVRELQGVAARLVETRPTEPAMQNSLARALVQVRQAEVADLKKLKESAARLFESQIKGLDEMLERTAEAGARIIRKGDTVLTHCHSHSVVEIFRQAKAQGKKFQVIVTETRPLYQGLRTAQDLLKARIPVTYCIDAAAGVMMKRATKVLVGSDALLPDGSVANKVGTFPIALLARQFGRPLYVVGETLKMTERVELEQRPPGEVINPKKLPGAKIANPAFDITPAEYIEGIITERGLVKPGLLKKFA
ncbi:MAG: translation initiation factor eIF-2B [Candidatus Aenigmatarchaeota archaeon]